jgi:hypothetical protein
VDGCHDRGVDEAAVGEREEVEAVVDDVELVGVLEDVGDVRALGRLGVDVVVLGPAVSAGAAECRGCLRVAGGEQRDVVAGCDESVGEKRCEQFPWRVVVRWGAPGDRGEDGDPQG